METTVEGFHYDSLLITVLLKFGIVKWLVISAIQIPNIRIMFVNIRIVISR